MVITGEKGGCEEVEDKGGQIYMVMKEMGDKPTMMCCGII